MKPQPERPGKHFTRKRLILLFCALASVLVIAFAGVTMLRGTFPDPVTPTPSPTTQSSVEPVSPLLFGTNISLFASAKTDQVLDSSVTRKTIQQMGVRIIRMPVRPGVSIEIEEQTARAIKDIGAVPLVILNGPVVPDPLGVDTGIVKMMNRVFGDSEVYYEFGNEEDLLGVPLERYVGSWNSIIPQLKKLAPNARFVGPVSYKYNRPVIKGFLEQANPQPDLISWHEYTCNQKSTPESCIKAIDTWTDHFADARKLMQDTIGTVLPIMITEWNYAPDITVLPDGRVVTNDGKHDNAAFMKEWTTKALNTLAANRIFASMHYAVTNTPLPMVGLDNRITPQGEAFSAMYQQIIVQKQEPSPISRRTS